MSISSKCPSTADLRELLEGNLADSDQVEIVCHLDGCSCCQHSLEALANGDSTFTATLQEQATYKPPAVNSAYWPALQKAEEALTVEGPRTRSSSGDISLAFLDP